MYTDRGEKENLKQRKDSVFDLKMASLRSCFRSENVVHFSQRNWLNFGLNIPKISRYRTGTVFLINSSRIISY